MTKHDCRLSTYANKHERHHDDRTGAHTAWLSTFSGRERTSTRISTRRKTVSILKSAACHGALWQPGPNTTAWLQRRGLNASDITRWGLIMDDETADVALSRVSDDLPIYLVLKILAKSTQSRKTFNDLVNLYRSVAERMDDQSHIVAISHLLHGALRLNSGLLRLLEDDIMRLPKSYTSSTFARFLSILCSSRVRHPQVHSIQALIIEEMHKRGLRLGLAGYKALLDGCAHDPNKFQEVQSHMIRAGYNLPGSRRRGMMRRHGPGTSALRDNLIKEIQQSATIKDCLDRIDTLPQPISEGEAWQLILPHYRQVGEARTYCMAAVECGRVHLTTYLTGLLLKTCKSRDQHATIDQVCQLAVRNHVKMDTFVWIEYLKRLIWSGRAKEVVTMLTTEPGGNALLDLPPSIRRDPRIWSATVQALNRQVSTRQCSGSQHARLLDKISTAMESFRVAFTQNALWCLVEAANLSGSRRWKSGHPCDVVVAIFKREVDLGKEPWKLPGTDLLWQAYMRVLVMNEETNLLVEAMTLLLATGRRPNPRLMRLFALGIWESGSIENLGYWQSYFEGELDIPWPTAEEAFPVRRHLEHRYVHDV